MGLEHFPSYSPSNLSKKNYAEVVKIISGKLLNICTFFSSKLALLHGFYEEIV